MQKIPFHIVSGFLGSGKTTFMKRIVEQYADQRKLGIIQNEYASSDIDGKELKATGKEFELLRINKGSVFCACLLADFSRSLEQFIESFNPDILILETTGLSDPTSVAEVLSTGNLGQKIYLATNWCVVDCFNYFKSGLMKQRVKNQIRMADVILLNKTDKVKDAGQIEQEVRTLNPFAQIIRTVHCDMEFVLGEMTSVKYHPLTTEPLGRPEINSMVIKSRKSTTRDNVIEFLKQWAPLAYRIKGYINLKNGTTLAVQCVYGTIDCVEMPASYYGSELIALTDRFTLREWNQSFRSLS